ncbi:MAG: ribulose-phosphate 3-epimerase [Clostridiales bacterium]|nr:ribulose-phosphate 3-epimerase [Clostridiales bacterium]
MNSKISASMMCADFLNLADDIRELERIKVDYLHIDIMDNHFVPNITLSPDYIRQVRNATYIPMDIHLMINEPERHLDLFDFKEDDIVSIHYESTPHIQRALKALKDIGVTVSIALNPATPIYYLDFLIEDIDVVLIMTVNPGYAGQSLVPETLEKIRDLRIYLDNRGGEHVAIEVDGNVSFENARRMRKKGADIFVAGSSSLFCADMSIKEANKILRESIA